MKNESCGALETIAIVDAARSAGHRYSWGIATMDQAVQRSSTLLERQFAPDVTALAAAEVHEPHEKVIHDESQEIKRSTNPASKRTGRQP